VFCGVTNTLTRYELVPLSVKKKNRSQKKAERKIGLVVKDTLLIPVSDNAEESISLVVF
jgi:hypothetical protein